VKSVNFREVLSLNLKAFRAEAGLSQDKFAARSGLHRTYIGSGERQERKVTLETLDLLSAAMGVTAADLLTPRKRKVSNGE
jgi:transcriptional regulator with XRE-family HTH domain